MKRQLLDTIVLLDENQFNSYHENYQSKLVKTSTSMLDRMPDDVFKYELYWVTYNHAYGKCVDPIGVRSYIRIGTWKE